MKIKVKIIYLNYDNVVGKQIYFMKISLNISKNNKYICKFNKVLPGFRVIIGEILNIRATVYPSTYNFYNL